MDEAQWLRCADPAELLAFARIRFPAPKAGWLRRTADRFFRKRDPLALATRKFRLFACACCRRALPLLTDDRFRATVTMAEAVAEGGVDPAGLAGVLAALQDEVNRYVPFN